MLYCTCTLDNLYYIVLHVQYTSKYTIIVSSPFKLLYVLVSVY